MEYIKIGKIVNTHGIKGELKIHSISDFDSIRYRSGATVYVLHEGTYLPMKVRSFRPHKGMSLVFLEGINDINEAERYRNDDVYIDAGSRKALPQGQYYFSDLENLRVIDEEGACLGICVGVEPTNGAQNNLRIVAEDGKEILVPFVSQFIQDVDLANGVITVQVIEGLL